MTVSPPLASRTVPASILEEIDANFIIDPPITYDVWTESSDCSGGFVRTDVWKLGLESAFVDHMVSVTEAGCDEADEDFS